MANYHRKTEGELARLDDERLLEAIIEAREAGDLEAAKRASGILAFRHYDRVEAKVAMRTPAQDVNDVAMKVMESAVRSAFDGRFLGQFGAWVNRIAQRRIADYHGAAGRQPEIVPLADEHDNDEEVWVRAPYRDDGAELRAVRDLAERIRCARPKEVHRHVIELYGPHELNYLGMSAAETRREIERLHPGETISEANIHQIWKRFRDDCAEALREAEGIES